MISATSACAQRPKTHTFGSNVNAAEPRKLGREIFAADPSWNHLDQSSRKERRHVSASGKPPKLRRDHVSQTLFPISVDVLKELISVARRPDGTGPIATGIGWSSARGRLDRTRLRPRPTRTEVRTTIPGIKNTDPRAKEPASIRFLWDRERARKEGGDYQQTDSDFLGHGKLPLDFGSVGEKWLPDCQA